MTHRQALFVLGLGCVVLCAWALLMMKIDAGLFEGALLPVPVGFATYLVFDHGRRPKSDIQLRLIACVIAEFLFAVVFAHVGLWIYGDHGWVEPVFYGAGAIGAAFIGVGMKLLRDGVAG